MLFVNNIPIYLQFCLTISQTGTERLLTYSVPNTALVYEYVQYESSDSDWDYVQESSESSTQVSHCLFSICKYPLFVLSSILIHLIMLLFVFKIKIH